jgi:hypothetical protein
MSALYPQYIHTKAAAFAHISGMLRAGGPPCPVCGVLDRAKPTTKTPDSEDWHSLKNRQDCGKKFTVRMGTAFECSHVKLNLWLQAIYAIPAARRALAAISYIARWGGDAQHYLVNASPYPCRGAKRNHR